MGTYAFYAKIRDTLDESNFSSNREAVDDIVFQQIEPSNSQKYQKMHATTWWATTRLSELLTAYDQGRRIKSVKDANEAFTDLKEVVVPVTYNLEVSQGSAVELKCKEAEEKIAAGQPTYSIAEIPNDGTNA